MNTDMTTTATAGTKYEATKALCATEIAALIRADIKAAVKAGELPKGKYSVRTGGSSMHSTIDVRYTVPGLDLFNADHLAWSEENPHAWTGDAPSNVRERRSVAAQAVESTLNAIVGAYNYDNSDTLVDYFDVRFYGGVLPAREWAEERETFERLIVRSRLVCADMARESAQADFLSYLGEVA